MNVLRTVPLSGPLLIGVTLLSTVAAAQTTEEAKRVEESVAVLKALTTVPEDGIPQHILDRAEAVVIIPNLVKGGFVVGAQHGRGVMTVRDREAKTWSLPSFVALTGGSVGWQIGVEAVDLVLLVMNKEGIDDLLKSEFKIGANASVAAGPVGRAAEASTDARMGAKILAYSRAKGLFAGATVQGASLRDDADANRTYYGRPVTPEEVFTGKVQAPSMVQGWSKDIGKLAAGSTAQH